MKNLLTLIKEKTMTAIQVAKDKIGNGRRIVSVQFTQGGIERYEKSCIDHRGRIKAKGAVKNPDLTEYSYITDLPLKNGDLVVVKARNGKFEIVTVTQAMGLTMSQRSKATKWIVCKLDLEQYQRRIEQEALVQEIKGKLQERREAYEERMIYETLAKEDPDIAALLDQLEKTASPTFLTGETLDESKGSADDK